jgi:hypothetical protein
MSEKFRDFLKSSIWKTIDFSTTDKSRGIKPPPAEKPCNPEDRRINLIAPGDWKSISEISVETAIAQRKSRRSYTEDTIKLEELSFLLWATQGLRGTDMLWRPTLQLSEWRGFPRRFIVIYR